MRCPFCGADDTQVKDSRPTEEGAAIRRRRACTGCGMRFTTFERVQLRELTVVKHGGKREPLDRDKLARSMNIALRKRNVDPERVERVINSIVRRLESSGESEVASDVVGEMVMAANGELVACSAPAGPALEGAQIRHGMRGAIGAVEKVDIDDDVICHVIGDAPGEE